MANRLFLTRPDAQMEHPPALPIESKDIPEGVIEGFEVYGPNLVGNPYEVLYQPNPCVVKEHGELYIQVGESKFWYEKNSHNYSRPNCPCWYQSGSTLRFLETDPDNETVKVADLQVGDLVDLENDRYLGRTDENGMKVYPEVEFQYCVVTEIVKEDDSIIAVTFDDNMTAGYDPSDPMTIKRRDD